MTSPLNLPAPGRCQAVYVYFHIGTALCFCSTVAWTDSLRLTITDEDPLSRSYRVSLPSSLTVIHSSALVYSTRLRVSVCGTGTSEVMFSGFSRQSAYPHYWIVPKDVPYCQVRLFPWICLRKSTSTLFNRLFRQPAAVSLLRPHVTLKGSNGILTVSAIGLAVRLNLRTRLTLIRLALIRKP